MPNRHEDQPVRHRRHFSANDSAILLAAVGECRRACITTSSKAPIGGPIYRAATRLIEEIDLMAEALTGDRRHFWLKPSSTPGSKQPTGPHPDTTIGAGSRRRRSESWKGVSYASRVSRFQCSTSRWNEPAIAVPYRVNHCARARQVAGWPFLEPMDRTGCQRVDLSGHSNHSTTPSQGSRRVHPPWL